MSTEAMIEMEGPGSPGVSRREPEGRWARATTAESARAVAVARE